MASLSLQLSIDKQKQEQILDTILNNANCTLSYNGRDYILLIKKQKNKDYCTMFLTDCSDKFWIQKMDVDYCEKLKVDMNVKTKTQVFAAHFVESLKNNPKIQEISPNAKLKLQIKVSEGLIINCPVTLSIRISNEQNPEEYKQLIRNFFKQLYEAKQSQIQTLKKELIKQKQQKMNEPNTRKVDNKDYVKSIFGLPEKKETPPSSKNRDLINPLKKKRRHQGIKLTGGD